VFDKLLQRGELPLANTVKPGLAVNPEVLVPARGLQGNRKITSLKNI
jgi:hypothetical protein